MYSSALNSATWEMSYGNYPDLCPAENKYKILPDPFVAGLLTRDSRLVERKKPGQKKARKKFAWFVLYSFIWGEVLVGLFL